MKKKKLLLGLVAVSAVFGLAACKTDEDKPTPPGPVVTTTYDVTFETNGHGTTPEKVTEVSKLPTLPTLTEEGWKFEGWYYDSACTKKAEAGEEIKENTKLYAKWTEDKKTPVEEKVVVTFDTQGGSTVNAVEVTKGGKVTKPATDPTKADKVFAGWYKESACTTPWNFDTDVVNADITIYAKWDDKTVEPPVVKHKVYFHLSENDEVTPVEVVHEELVDEPETPQNPYKTFKNWYTSPTNQTDETVFGFGTPILEDTHLYAGWEQAYDTVTTPMNFEDFLASVKAQNLLDESGKLNADSTFGRFTFEKGTKFESTLVNTQGKYWSFELMGDGANNSFTFSGEGGSTSGDTDLRLYKLNADGITWDIVKSLGLAPNKTTLTGEETGLEAGTYKITTSYSFKMKSFTITEKLPKGPTNGIELGISQVNKNFLLGRAFDYSGLTAQLVYENGRKDDIALTDLNVSVEDFTTAGKKTVKVSYKLNDDTTYTQSYTVNVCEVEDIVLYDYTITVGSGTVKYVTNNLQKLFDLNGTFNHDNLVVKAKCLLPETTDKYIEFILDANEYTVTPADLKTLGNKTVHVIYTWDTTKTADYDVEVVDIPNLSGLEYIAVGVDPEKQISTIEEYNFHTINQALQFMELSKVADNASKALLLVSGRTYFEKVEINIPNLILTNDWAYSQGGFDPIKDTAESYAKYRENSATIEFNALSGVYDPSGSTVHSTEGSATVCVRPDAEGFNAFGITFKNYYNTNELYKESLKITNDTQAVALLNQADKSTFVGCVFTSYHDTLEAQIGRQYYLGCHIEGRTDYIFGYNATAYFEKSVIHTIGDGLDQNNGGYIVATKGLTQKKDNKAVDAIEYGYIFNDCTFTADDKTMNGSTSIARGWDIAMRTMVMNSKLGAHISTEAYGEVTPEGKNLNDRYGKMNAEPVANQLLEYNNEGAGAIQASLPNTCTVITDATVAASYANLKTIFAAVNGQMTYSSAWSGPWAQPDATIIFKKSDGTEFAKFENFGYIGSTISEEELKELIQSPTGFSLEGFYSDADCTIKYDFTKKLEETNEIYVKFVDASLEKIIQYNFLDESVNGGWTTTATNTTPIGNAIGVTGDKNAADYDVNKLASVHKIELNSSKSLNTSLTSPIFEGPTKKVTLEVVGGTTSTSNAAEYMKIEALDANGEVVDSIIATTPTGKITGKFTYKGSDIIKFESTSAFVQLRFSCTTDTKGYGILSSSISYVVDDGSEIPDPDAPVAHKNAFNWSAISTDKLTANGKYTQSVTDGSTLETPIAKYDGSAITNAVFAGTDNAFINVIEGAKVTYRDGVKCFKEFNTDGTVKTSTNPSLIEIQGEALTVTFTGTGTLTISFASTSGSNESTLAVKDASGTNLVAENPTGVTLVGDTYVVKGTSAVTLTFNITAPGTYTIWTDNVTTAYKRATRISAITMVDNYKE